MTISGTTRLLGIIGDPVGHSFSPDMQNQAIAELGLDYVYVPFPVAPANLGAAMAGFAATGVVGFNATIPHKQAVMEYLDVITPEAQAIGAVNTVWRSDRGWEGTNTDVTGFIAPLQDRAATDEKVRRCFEKPLVLLGNGGAARAVVAGAAKLGCPKVQVAGRSAEKVAAFVESWQDSPIAIQTTGHSFEALPELLPEAGIVVNSTPLGMNPNVERSPLTDELAECISPDAIAYDLIYTPSPTRFLEQAAGRGALAIDGLEMLVRQGAAALEIWVERELTAETVETMRRALKARLGLS
ncbi:MAG: shikimate dehydrogenase [Geitlerinemataceae cyanobacterium]